MFKLDKESLTKQYPHLKEIIKGYKDPDKEIVFNVQWRQDGDVWHWEKDPDLDPIKIDMATIIKRNVEYWSPNSEILDIQNPKIEKIDGFGDTATEQWFKKPTWPTQLLDLERNYFDMRPNPRKDDADCPSVFWQVINENPGKYRESLLFIERQTYFMRYGYWFFNNGKPTYITGRNYRHLVFFRQGTLQTRDKQTGKVIKLGTPEYRDRHRSSFMFMNFCLTDTTDHTGKDFGARTCVGVIGGKTRRAGETACAVTFVLDTMIIPETYSSFGADSGPKAKDTFVNKFMVAQDKQPCWLTPMSDSIQRAKTSLNNSKPGRKNLAFKDYLDSHVDYCPTAQRNFYDGLEISGVHLSDEQGKSESSDVQVGWDLTRLCLAPGGGTQIRKFALALLPSTIEEVTSDAGANFFKIMGLSKYYETSELTGQTASGLREMFFPSYLGLEGFVGKYGESLLENLTEAQQKFLGKNHGAKEFISKNLLKLKAIKGSGGNKNYNSFLRKHPVFYRDMLHHQSSDIGFNKEKMSARLVELELNPPPQMRTGNFLWQIGDKKYTAEDYLSTFGKWDNPLTYAGKVIWEDDPEGKFIISEMPTVEDRNQKIRSNDQWDCVKTKYISSTDTFNFLTDTQFKKADAKDSTKMSKGAGAVFRCQDENIDSKLKDVTQWSTYHFVCDYIDRPKSSDIYGESMLMMTLFYSAICNPESNLTLTWQHFKDRGFEGFLLHEIDLTTGLQKEKPGFKTTTVTKPELFDGVRGYVEHHLHKENHARIIEEFSKIKSMDDMTNRDLFVAAAGSLRGAEQMKYYVEDVEESSPNLNGYY
jgi:hypothetical protein